MGYYNTTNLEGEELKEAKGKAKTQDQVIVSYLEYYTDHLDGVISLPFRTSSSRILQFVFDEKDTPIQSIRRAITNLVNAGKIEYVIDEEIGKFKTVLGKYGKGERLIQLKK